MLMVVSGTIANGSPAGGETVGTSIAGGSAGYAGYSPGFADTVRRQRASRGGDPTQCRAQHNRRA
jgi:hypothetical protein